MHHFYIHLNTTFSLQSGAKAVYNIVLRSIIWSSTATMGGRLAGKKDWPKSLLWRNVIPSTEFSRSISSLFYQAKIKPVLAVLIIDLKGLLAQETLRVKTHLKHRYVQGRAKWIKQCYTSMWMESWGRVVGGLMLQPKAWFKIKDLQWSLDNKPLGESKWLLNIWNCSYGYYILGFVEQIILDNVEVRMYETHWVIRGKQPSVQCPNEVYCVYVH